MNSGRNTWWQRKLKKTNFQMSRAKKDETKGFKMISLSESHSCYNYNKIIKGWHLQQCWFLRRYLPHKPAVSSTLLLITDQTWCNSETRFVFSICVLQLVWHVLHTKYMQCNLLATIWHVNQINILGFIRNHRTYKNKRLQHYKYILPNAYVYRGFIKLILQN